MARARNRSRDTRPISYVHDWFFDGYEEVEFLGTDGKMQKRMDYHGKVYGFEKSPEEMKQQRIRYAVLLGLTLAVWALGCLFMSPMAARLPGAFFAIVMVPELFYIVGFIRFCFLKEEFNNRKFHQSYKRMEMAAIVKAPLAGLSLLLAILWYIFVDDATLSDWRNLVTTLCCAAMLAIGVAELKMINGFRYKILRDKDKVVVNADFSKGEKEAKPKPKTIAEYYAEAEEDEEEE